MRPVADLRAALETERDRGRWKKLYGGMEPSEARELRMLREENIKLKKLVADLSPKSPAVTVRFGQA